MDYKRVIVIVLDGVGIGAAPDAELYGDVGSNSIANTARVLGGLHLPQMGALGLGCITNIEGVHCPSNVDGAYGRLQPQSAGKDTVSGHWALMGVHLSTPFPTFPDGFPLEIVEAFVKKTGVGGVLGNKAASGTEIIQEFGLEHINKGWPIIYTSADSVFQIAAHEETIPVPQLYVLCKQARNILSGEYAVGRVIARPFLGNEPGSFRRTDRRRDYPLYPDTPTILDKLVSSGMGVYSVGKIDDIFGGRGITQTNHTLDNEESVRGILKFLGEDFEGLLFANLIEFDMIYGHRNDPKGYGRALEAFDKYIPRIRQSMKPTDLAMIVSDHGVDPTTASTDHSREYVPLLVFGDSVKPNTDLGTRHTYCDVAATIAEVFSLEPPTTGNSFLREVSMM